MRRLTAGATALLLLLAPAQTRAAGSLDVYFIDVEGGQATLVVTPSGKSLLIDAGYPERAGRDPDRIMAAVRDAHLTRIDYLLITHFHEDHNGGVPELARRLPIRTFVDYGAPVETASEVISAFAAYEQARRSGDHLVPEPGDRLPLDDVAVEVVSVAGATLSKPLGGGGAVNDACATFERRADNRTENPRSIGVRVRFGAFRFVDLGDLVWNKLGELVCPSNMLGEADVYLVAHHGNGDAHVPAVLAGLRPRVAVINNGPYKGGNASVLASLRGLPGTEDVWQLHRSASQGTDSSNDAYIANLEDDDADRAAWIRLTAREDGSFTVINGRTGWTKTYEAR